MSKGGLAVARWWGLAALVGLAGCAAPGTDFEALPFYREDRTTPGIVRADVPLLLFTYDHLDAERAGTAPIASYATPEKPPVDEDITLVRFPYPFGNWLHDGKRTQYLFTSFIAAEGVGLGTAGPGGRSLSTDADVRADPIPIASDAESGGVGTLPFVFYDTFIDHNDLPDMVGEDEDHDFGLLPLFAAGNGTRDEEDYLAIMPFGGKTKGLLGKDEILWVGFPYPLYARAEDRRYVSHHILWPLVNWIEDEPTPESTEHHEGFRILPFYGHYARTTMGGVSIYDRTFILWPLFTWTTEGAPWDEAETETIFLFPFYGQIRGPYQENTTVLWPFFRWEHSKIDDYWEVRAPFPFVQLSGGPDGRWKRDFWPLFGMKHRPGYDRWFALWPLLRSETLEDERRTFDGFWAMPLFWHTSWKYKEHGTEEATTRLYPLLHHRRTPGGTVDFAALSPWWWDDPGFERTLGSLLRLYHYHRDPSGGVEHQALLGLFSWRDLPALEEPRRPDYWRLSLLFGLFQLRSLGDEGGLRLFWLPEITWGDREGPS